MDGTRRGSKWNVCADPSRNWNKYFQTAETWMDRFESMSAFVAVVEAGGFSAASRRLGTPLASLSRRVSELEDHLGAQLLDRAGKRIALTERGRQYFDVCRAIIEDLQQAERAAAGEPQSPRGELIVTAPIVFGRLHVVPVAAEFLKAYPEVEVEVRQSDRVVNLIGERVDLAVRFGQLADSTLMAIRIGSSRRVLCASPRYLAERGVPRRPSDLAAHDCIAYAGPSTSDWTFKIAGAPASVRIRSRLTVTNAEAALDAAATGAGIALAFLDQAAPAIAEGKLVAVLDQHAPDPLPLSLVYPAGLVPPKLRAFLDFAAPRLRARLQSLEAVVRPVR
jgi:DNA-binding transcriptional LysR family regulator